MNHPWPRLLVTLVLGLLTAGPLAAVTLVALPAGWRGPAVPAAVLAGTLLVLVGIRHHPVRNGGRP
ncbi:MAG: hypothetical protein AB1806_06005, partial [Acidobacteriota bacterium]